MSNSKSRYLSGVLVSVELFNRVKNELTLSMKSTLWACLFFVYTEEKCKVSGRGGEIFMSVTTVEHYLVKSF